MRFVATGLISIAIIAATLPPMQAAGGKMGHGYLAAFRETMDQLIRADGALLEQMRYTSDRIYRYYQKFGHFPAPGVPQENFKASILRHFNFNPYRPQVTDLYYNQQLPEESKTHLYILTDSTLTIDNAREYKKAPPQSWQGEPGSIFVITNGESVYMIWGASADRLPLRDHRTENKIMLIYHDFRAEKAN
jgi:hypothetical protein